MRKTLSIKYYSALFFLIYHTPYLPIWCFRFPLQQNYCFVLAVINNYLSFLFWGLDLVSAPNCLFPGCSCNNTSNPIFMCIQNGSVVDYKTVMWCLLKASGGLPSFQYKLWKASSWFMTYVGGGSVFFSVGKFNNRDDIYLISFFLSSFWRIDFYFLTTLDLLWSIIQFLWLENLDPTVFRYYICI